MSSKYPKTPELDKMKAVKEKSQACGELLEWLEQEHGLYIGKPHVHSPACPGWDSERERYNPDFQNQCPIRESQFERHELGSREQLLAKFYGIDLKKVDDERQAILDYIRNQKS